MAKMRVTLEYELEEGADIAQEQKDWIEGNVSFQDIWALFADYGDEGCKVKFETLTAGE